METQSSPKHQTAIALEEYLGEPNIPDNIFSFKNCMAWDEQEQFPTAICDLLANWNFHHHTIPVQYGGKLQTFEEFFTLLRVVARRDLTPALYYLTMLGGATIIWMEGDEQQKRKVALAVKEKDNISIGLTEKIHGSNLVASEVEAVESESGYLLNGEKWLVNGATRNRFLALLAKHVQQKKEHLSLFLLDKKQIASSSYSNSPKIKTLGVRGADISGISFDNCCIAKDSIIGTFGNGFITTIKDLQITRTLVTGLSLGAADTALRTTIEFALSRKLYGDTVFKLPQVQKKLSDAFLDVIMCDIVAIAMTRALHTIPQQMSMLSAVAKYFVPVTIEKAIHSLSIILGARHYLREEYKWGIFQKILRDNALISVFDGSTQVNLHSICLQFKILVDPQQKEYSVSEQDNIKNTYGLKLPLPDFSPDRYKATIDEKDLIMGSVPSILVQLKQLEKESDVDLKVVTLLTILAQGIAEEISLQENKIRELLHDKGMEAVNSPQSFEIAEKYCLIHAAIACIQMWLHNRICLPDFFSKGEWVVLCVNRIMKQLSRPLLAVPSAYEENILSTAIELYQKNCLFSIIPIPLAKNREPALT